MIDSTIRLALLLCTVILPLLAGGALGSLLHAAQSRPHAAFSVTNTNDSGPGSLRQAILDANQNPGTVTHSLFQQNQSALSSGGAFYAQGSLTLHATQFLSNTARGNGAALAVAGDRDVIQVHLSQALFQNNHSSIGMGGALSASGGLSIDRSTFLHNSASGGGALFHHTFGDLRLSNTLFAQNDAAGGAAAIRLQSPMRATLVHDTIVGPAPFGWPAVEIVTGSVAITNSIVASHTTGIARSAGLVTQDYNLFSGNNANLQGVIGGGAHSFTAPPHFVAPTIHDHHLQPASPARDSGTDAGVYEDVDGDPRPYNNAFDIGYDEIAAGSIPPTPTPTTTPAPTATATPGPSPTPSPADPSLYLPYFRG